MAIVNEYTLTFGGKSFSAHMTPENAKIAVDIINKFNNPEPQYHTYFISYLDGIDVKIIPGNAIFATTSTGQLLVKDAMAFIESTHPNAVLISISKLD